MRDNVIVMFLGRHFLEAIDSTRHLSKLQGAIRAGAYISCISVNKNLTANNYQDVQLLHHHLYTVLATRIVYGTQ